MLEEHFFFQAKTVDKLQDVLNENVWADEFVNRFPQGDIANKSALAIWFNRAMMTGAENSHLVIPGSETSQDVDAPEDPLEPRLGCATTEQMFEELITRFLAEHSRFEMAQKAVQLAQIFGDLDSKDREYRKVDH